MLTYWFTHGLANLSIGSRILERCIGDPNTSGGNVDPSEFKSSKGLVETLALLATNKIIDGDSVVIKDQFCRVDSLLTQFFQFPADRKPRSFLGQEQTHAPMTG